MCDMCVYFVLNIQRLWLIYPIRLVICNLSMSIAIIYTQHQIITPAIPILNHQPNVFNFEIRRSFTRYSQNALLGCPILFPFPNEKT